MRAARLLIVPVLAVALLTAMVPGDHVAARVPPFKKVAVLFLENHGAELSPSLAGQLHPARIPWKAYDSEPGG